MKKNIIAFLFVLLILPAKTILAQGVYISALESGMNSPISKYEEWLKKNGFVPTVKYNTIAVGKAETLSAIYNVQLTTIVYEAKRQPIRIYCYMDTKQILKCTDIHMINPEAGEYENIQLVLLKSGFKLESETNNQNDKYTLTYFRKKNIRLNLTHPEDGSYIIISATTLSNYE